MTIFIKQDYFTMIHKPLFFALVLICITPTFALADKSQVTLDAKTTLSLKALVATYESQMDIDNSVSLSLVDKETYQPLFDIVAKGTKLEGYKLATSDFILTDGKEGIDTVIYKNKRSDYSLYRGNDIPDLGYKNVSIVKGKKDKFVQIDVNSEFYQFKDKQLSIPDYKPVQKKTGKEDVTIAEITISRPDGIGHSNNGSPVPDQKVTVTLTNNEFGIQNPSDRKLKYLAELYEIKGNKVKKTKIKSTGETLIPGMNAPVTFDLLLAGGIPSDGDINPKEYKVKVTVDTSNKVKEVDEKNNTGWSNVWEVTYYKG